MRADRPLIGQFTNRPIPGIEVALVADREDEVSLLSEIDNLSSVIDLGHERLFNVDVDVSL